MEASSRLSLSTALAVGIEVSSARDAAPAMAEQVIERVAEKPAIASEAPPADASEAAAADRADIAADAARANRLCLDPRWVTQPDLKPATDASMKAAAATGSTPASRSPLPRPAGSSVPGRRARRMPSSRSRETTAIIVGPAPRGSSTSESDRA